jgi:hypothetical protein
MTGTVQCYRYKMCRACSSAIGIRNLIKAANLYSCGHGFVYHSFVHVQSGIIRALFSMIRLNRRHTLFLELFTTVGLNPLDRFVLHGSLISTSPLMVVCSVLTRILGHTRSSLSPRSVGLRDVPLVFQGRQCCCRLSEYAAK